MVDPLDLYAPVLTIAIDFAAIYFAYKVTRISGGFRAWWLIISGFTLITGRWIVEILLQFGINVIMLDVLSDILLPLSWILLLLGMYDLVKIFLRRSRLNEQFERETKVAASEPGKENWQNDKYLDFQASQLFQRLWEDAVLPRENKESAKIAEVELREESKVLPYRPEIISEVKRLIGESKSDLVIHVAKDSRLPEDIEFLRVLSERAVRGGARIRVLSPESFRSIFAPISGLDWRSVEELKITLVIADRRQMLIVYYEKPVESVIAEERNKQRPSLLGVLTTNKPAIVGVSYTFESLWHESELRKREEKSRRQAELLQDVLTHDIRNYNQISKLSAELLSEILKNNPEVQPLLDSLISAIDGSTTLVERGKQLGKILSEESPPIHSMNLIESIERAMGLVRKVNPNKSIVQTNNFSALKDVKVLADDFLDEVFVNIFSNAVKYTEGNEVPIEIQLKLIDESVTDKANTEGKFQPQCEITVSDRGVGIPEANKERLFSRYLEGAKGSGLGLAIVHALVVGRYNGKVTIGNRKGAEGKGVVVRVWLPRASPETEKARPSVAKMS